MFPAFTNVLLLGGLVGVTAPILIHLLLRRRSQKMRFSTVQFFIKKDEQSMRKRKLRNLLLLSLRVLLFALLVLAFAKPYLPNGAAAATTKRQQTVILLDTSASMQSGEQWKRAKDLAKKTLAALQNDDRAALVLCATHSSTLSGFVPPSVLAKKLDDVQPGYGLGDINDGLQQALKVLTTANPAQATSLNIISDLQRPATQNVASVPLPKELVVKIDDPVDRFSPNVSVTDLRLEREGDVSAHASITSFSDENYSALPYRLTIDGKEILAGTVTVPSGTSTNLPLAIPALKPGWHSAEFAIHPRDSLGLDDTRFATVLVPDPIRCVVIESQPTAKSYQQQSFFVAAALNPSTQAEVSASRFTYEKATLDTFPSLLKAEPGKAPVQLVVLPAIKQVSAAAASALRTFVRKGGGLLLFLGENVSANSYNTELGDLLPAELGRTQIAPETSWHFGQFKNNSPAFALFAGAGNGNLTLHEFTQRFSLKPKTNSEVIAQFQDSVPLVVEQKLGEGRIILVNSSADTRWTDWQKHKSFVPWLHSTAFYLSGRNPSEQRDNAPSFNSGSEVDLAISLKQQAIKIQRTGSPEVALQSDDDGTLRDVPLPVPGIYSVKDAVGAELRRIAVNVPTAESDLTFGAPAETEQQLVRREESEPTTLAAGLFGESQRGKELWRMLLMAALVFLVVEPIVANRTAA